MAPQQNFYLWQRANNSLEQKTSRPKLTLAMQNARMDYLSVLVPFDRCLPTAAAALVPKY